MLNNQSLWVGCAEVHTGKLLTTGETLGTNVLIHFDYNDVELSGMPHVTIKSKQTKQSPPVIKQCLWLIFLINRVMGGGELRR